MGTDALKALREWQRSQASEQDQAFRQAARALERLERLEQQRVEAQRSLAAGVASLDASGVGRDQAAALLGVAPDELGRLIASARRAQAPDTRA